MQTVAPAGGPVVSRRTLLSGAGGFGAGVALGLWLAGKAPSAAAQPQQAPPLPWPYRPLDPDRVAKRAYDGYWKAACAYGVANAIIGELADTVGYPFTLLPPEVFRYGEGGVVGWGTICGALNGAGAAICLVTPREAYVRLIHELLGWYTQAAIPQYKPPEGIELPTSQAGSPLCHVSVSRWCDASGYRFNSKELWERCGRLTADVARQAVILLNAHHAGAFAPAYVAPGSVDQCMSCHGAKALDDTHGRMDCLQCHEPHD